MTIIISEHGQKAQKVAPSSFADEDYLQKYIYENPDAIPVYDIKDDVRLLILSREFPTTSGPIDALGIDREGTIYIIETKLYKNPDKRTVISQALDYGAALWRHANDFDAFLQILESSAEKIFEMTLRQKLLDFFELSEDDLPSIFETMKTKLNDGGFRFVILMDRLDSRLKDLIVFMNENSRFDVYAVELSYYKHDKYEIMIPKIFGTEVKKDVRASSSGSQRRKWDEASFKEALREQADQRTASAVMEVYDFSKETADTIRWGTGIGRGSFSPIFSSVSAKSVFTVWTDGTLTINFVWLVGYTHDESFCERLKSALEDDLGLVVSDDWKTHSMSYQADEWIGKSGTFIEVMKNLS